ncbi:hypothetical protein ACRRTK_009153 [Alexandromys fortis]
MDDKHGFKQKLTGDISHTCTQQPTTGDNSHTCTQQPTTGDNSHTCTQQPTTGDNSHTCTQQPTTGDNSHTCTQQPTTGDNSHTCTQQHTTEVTRPESTIPAGRSLADITSSPKEDSHSEVLSTHPQTSFPSTAYRVTDQTAEKLVPEIPAFQAHSELQKAYDILQRVRNSPPTSPTPAQVSVANLLIDLSEQLLLLILFQNNGSRNFITPTSPLQALGSTITTMEGSQQVLLPDTEQVEDMLEMSLMALGEIHKAFSQQSLPLESAVTLTSPVATVVLSSHNVSSLPLSTYTLDGPAPLRLGFPSAKALKELLNKYPGVNLQVTGLAFNPFETSDDRNIVGSIGNVLLSSDYQSLQVHDLIEDIEIVLWRNASMEIQPTNLNTSTDRFTVTVNVTSVEKTLIVTIEPESPLLMTLYLGFQDKQNHTHFYHNTSLPRDQVWQKDEEYTWVLTPESLQYGTGTYYIMAVVNKSTEATQHTPILVSVVTAVTQCYFWDRNNRTWRSDGCQVGLQSTMLKTQCLCNHLTFFSSDFFVLPRTVDVENTIKLLLHVTSNPVGVSLLASLLGFYLLLGTWAWRKDRADLQKVKLTILADNDPGSAFHYLIQVYTGYRRRAATTAQVVITLYGSEGHSEPHHLCDPQKRVFEQGALDVFLLSTGSWLGDLHGLRLWHDNSGDNPSWYVSQVIVSDMTVKKKWHFRCSCWLAVDLGHCERDRVFTPASRRELSSFSHLFSSTIVEKFTQDYLWLSVVTRHPWSQFTRVQRLSCCMTLLLCDMVINVMFWKMGATTAKRGPLAVTWSEIVISFQTAIILFPIHLVFGRLFQLIHPPESLPPLPPTQAACPSGLVCESPSPTQVVMELKQTVGFLLRRNAHLLSEREQSSWSSCDIDTLVTLLSSLICSHLEEQGCHQQTEARREDGVVSLASAFFTTLYSLELSKDQATSWVISMLLSVLQDIFVSQPMKVIVLSFLFSLTANQMPWLNKDKEQHAKRIVALWGFITDGNSFLLGNVLLRQIRVPNSTLFPVSLHEPENSQPQHQEDRENYGVRWAPPDTNITETDSIWHYQNQELLGGYPIQGEFATYSGGGYVVRLGRNASAAARVLQHLEQRRWLDHGTKVLFVELTVFNANVNLLCAVTLILESNSVGTFFTSLRLDSLTSLQSSERSFAWIISQVSYYLLVCYYTFIQGCRLKRQRWKFLTRKRNLLDTSIILISFSILGLNIQSLSLLHKNMLQYRRDRDRFISFYEALKVNSAVTHLMGFLVLLATVQLWDILRHNAQFQLISKTLNKAWDEVVGFILLIVILLSSYAMTFNLLFGWSISDYQSFFSSTVTVVGLLMGISSHKEVIALYPVLGSFLVLTSIILMGLVIINLFVSAVLIVFGKERKALEKEATLTDILLQKLSSLLGIRQQQNPSSEKHADNTGY